MVRKVFITAGGETVLDICERFQVSRDSLISVNSGGGSVRIGGTTYDNTSSYLNRSSLLNKSLQKNVNINIPDKLSGGLDKDEVYEYDYESDSKLNKIAVSSRSRVLDNFECYFTKIAGGSVVGTFVLPIYPQEFSDNNSPEFNSQSMFGRSVSYQIYNTSSRSVSFTLQLHEEIVEGDYDYVHQVVSEIESACYPEYGASSVQPPEVLFTIGKQFKIRGILSNCSAVWTPPIIDGRLVNCNLSIGVVETTGPYSMSDVAKFKGYREGSSSSQSYSSSTTTNSTAVAKSISRDNSANESYAGLGYTTNRVVPMTR